MAPFFLAAKNKIGQDSFRGAEGLVRVAAGA